MTQTAQRPIKVMHLITSLDRGGAETILRDVVANADRERFELVVVVLFGSNTPIAHDIRAHGVRVIDVAMSAKWRVDGFVRLLNTIRRESPDILQGWLYHTVVLARVCGRICNVPIVIGAHHSISTEAQHRDLLYRLTRNMDTHAIAVCDAVRDIEIERSGVAPGRIVTIHNGIPNLNIPDATAARAALVQELGLPSSARLIGTVARLSKAKGYPDYARAIKAIVARYPDAHFVWVGDGEERASLDTLIQQLGIGDHVHMLGERGDVVTLLAGMDMFVLPSLWEGLSIALLEAMAAGLPVVSTAVGGTPEVVVDGETGLLVAPSDPRVLENGIIQLLADPARAQQMGRAGQQRVAAKFTARNMVQEMESLYDSLLNGRPD